MVTVWYLIEYMNSGFNALDINSKSRTCRIIDRVARFRVGGVMGGNPDTSSTSPIPNSRSNYSSDICNLDALEPV
jgi:hypothetical protein